VADEELGTASVKITLDDSSVEASLNRLANRIERSLSEAARDGARRMQRQLNLAIAKINPLKVEITADTTRFRAALNTLNNLGSSPLRITPDVNPERFRRELQRQVRGIYVRVEVRPNLAGFDERIRQHRPPAVDVRVRPNVDSRATEKALKSLSKIFSAFGTTLKVGGLLTAVAAGIAAVGAAAASATVNVLAFGSALAPAAGIVAALPATIAGLVVAINTLKLATNGVGDAFKAVASGDAEKLDKALKKLSPSAQKVVLKFKELQPELKKIQQSVQEGFFKQFAGDLDAVFKNLSPLGPQLATLGEKMGLVVKQAASFASTPAAFTGLTSVIKGVQLAVSGLSTATQPLLKGFLDFAAVVSDAFGAKLGNAIAQLGSQFGTFLSTAAASGRAVEWVDHALVVFRQLGTIASNVGHIIGDVFATASTVGGGLLGNLEKVTGEIRKFTESDAGVAALSQVFTALTAVAAQFAPIIKSVAGVFGALAPSIATIANILGPAVVSVINAISEGVKALAPGLKAFVDAFNRGLAAISTSGAFTAIGEALGNILEAIAPLLPVIGSLVGQLTAALAPAISAVARALGPVVEAFSKALLPVIPVVAAAITKLVDALTPFLFRIGGILAGLITAAAPLLDVLAQAFLAIATAAGDALTQLSDGLLPVLASIVPAIAKLVTAFAPLILQIVQALIPAMPPLINAFLAIVNAILPLIPIIADLLVALAPLISKVIEGYGQFIALEAAILSLAVIKVVVPIIQILVTELAGIIGWLTRVANAVNTFTSDLPQKFEDMKMKAGMIIAVMINQVTSFFRSLPGKVSTSVEAMKIAVVNKFQEAKNQAVAKAIELVSSAQATIQGLPGKIRSALGDLGDVLFSAGGDLVDGFINGIQSRIGSAVSAARNLASSAKSAVEGFLDINSPSKVFYQIGVFVGKGFVNGMTSTAASIQSTADKLAKLVTDAFKGKNTTRDDTLVAFIRARQKELTKLVNQREALIQRIKDANEFAAQTTQSALQSFGLNELATSGSVAGRGGLTDRVNKAAAQIRRFNAQIEALAKRGVSRSILSQLIGLGPEQGRDLANQLSNATNAQLRELNKAQASLDAAAKKFGQDSADRLFDAGKNAAKGFLAGLKGQQKDIENLMISIAKGLQKAIRQALGIHSPSTVLKGIGEDTGRGFVNGVKAMTAPVRKAAQVVAQAAITPFSGTAAVMGGGLSAPSARVAAAARPVAGLSDPFRYRTDPASSDALRRATRPSDNVVITNNFTINEVGNAEATASRVVNRLALTAGVL
jgi:phage-related protein